MKAFRRLLIPMLIAVLNFVPNFASNTNDSSRISYGIWGDVHQNYHSADFKKLPDCPSCSPGFNEGDGIGFGIGAVVDVPIWERGFLSGKFLYKTLDAKLVRTQSIMVGKEIVDETGQTTMVPTLGEFEHSIDTKISIIGLEPSIKYNLFDNLFLNGGFQGAFISTKEYAQVERIVNPKSGTFMDGAIDTYSRKRNEISGTLQSANSIYFGANLSLSYQLPLNKTNEWFLEPELSYALGLTNLVNDELVKKWKANSLGLGIAVKYSPKAKVALKDEYKRIENIDTVKLIVENIDKEQFLFGITQKDTSIVENDRIRLTQETTSRTDTIKFAKKYVLNGDIEAVGIDSLGIEIKNPIFQIVEFTNNQLEPLLNYVFFDENSSELPNRYKTLSPNETNKYRFENLIRENTLSIYHDNLNIIGKRMQGNPNSTLKIVGCNSGIGEENNNRKLSQARAENVKNYLMNIWKIDANRLIVSAQNMPEKASTPKDELLKTQENQRVEFYSDDYKILEPIFIEKVDRIADPPIIRFKLNVTSEAGIKNWEINSYQNSDSENRFVSRGESDIPKYIDWDLAKYQKFIPKAPEAVMYSLNLEDKKGNQKTIEAKTLPIDVITIQRKKQELLGDIAIEKFKLILFDFDNHKVSKSNQKIIDFINQRIKHNSEVTIIGYTDVTGNQKHNNKLAYNRAKSIQKLLHTGTISIESSNNLLFDNDLPEGRLYCRTVEIIVKTKIK